MESDSWLEPRTRIPFVGIIAITLIVIVVAVFVKTQIGPLFPASDITVQEAGNAPAITGRATSSSSFIGLREIDLQRQEYLRGVLNTGEGSQQFTADIPRRMLVIEREGVREEIILAPSSNDPTIFTAIFDNNNLATRVDLDTGDLVLRYSEPGKSVGYTSITLGTVVTYEGTFKFRNQQYTIQFVPGSEEAIIAAGSVQTVVPLLEENGLYSGTWQDDRNIRPITINPKRLQAVIEDVY
ncbi:TPA: hypothetical protein HA251_08775 [Candidatus Woesearchaeota archaeon]|nr:hypothetical protein [Candidatus Woesearchaeota archaeon]